MVGSDFLALVNYYGESNIIGIGFDNSGGVTFGENEFSLTNNYVPELESIQMIGYDTKGLPFHIVKHVENIQSVLVRDSNVPFNAYDRVGIRG